MKKTFTILFALMVLCFTQCKPTPKGGDENGRKVKVSCTIPINNGGKSDFTNLMEDGKINWSTGTERVYLAIPNETSPQIVELTAFTTMQASELAFEGEVEEGLLEEGKEYEVWYLGNSKNLDVPYVTETKEGDVITSISGSIAYQSGKMKDLGYCHIAKVKVTAVEEEGKIVLPLRGVLKSQIAIAYLDLDGVADLNGNAIKGTEYSLQYNRSTNEYDFVVTENPSANIEVTHGTATSFVVLLPNEKNNVILKSWKGGYEFQKGVESNKFYYRYISNVEKGTLRWAGEPGVPDGPNTNGHEYVNLGLPSGLLWATCNIGANVPEEDGKFYAWGEINTKDTYVSTSYTISGWQMNDISGNIQYDAAKANWGGDWRMPTKAEQEELLNNCTWTWMIQNNGWKVTGPNGNYIYLPNAGGYNTSPSGSGSYGYYWSSTPLDGDVEKAYFFNFTKSSIKVGERDRALGGSVRPVLGGNYEVLSVQYAFVETNEVTQITHNSAICGGNVTTDNGSAVIARGVCWSRNENPTIDDYIGKTSDGIGVGSFISYMTLSPNTTYYIRAYVINAVGVNYGKQITFKTNVGEANANGHEYVDLGLSVKWATCNVGAVKPENYGNYYAWGETTTKEFYSSANSTTYGKEMNDISGNAQYDAATANWGGDWRMPTQTEIEELINNCTWNRTTQNSVKGYKVTSKTNGNYIFLPNAGYFNNSTHYNGSSSDYCYYWSSTPSGSGSAYHLDDATFNYDDYFSRITGLPVRPVID